MTKYEWETELKRKIGRLPADEIKRVLDYYGELFEDMAERGKTELDIINEFGNPADVADKILSEYDGEPTRTPDTPSATEKASDGAVQNETDRKERVANGGSIVVTEKRGRLDTARLALFVVFNVLTGGVLFILLGVGWILLAAFVASGAIMVLGGGLASLSAFAVMFTGHAGAGFAQFGLGIACAGLGILFAVGFVLLTVLYLKLNKAFFGWIGKFLTVREG